MSKVLTDNQYYGQIANIIREQNGTSNTYTPPQMVSALKDLFYEEVEGVPPITFQGIGENLLDYRIDGNSSENLFNINTLLPYYIDGGTGKLINTGQNSRTFIIDCEPNTSYVYSNTNVYGKTRRVSFFSTYPDSTTSVLSFMKLDSIEATNDNLIFTTPNNANYAAIYVYGSAVEGINYTIEDFFSQCMVNVGSTALPYEPYGDGVGDRTGNLAKWDTHLLPQPNGIVLNDLNSISSIIDVTSINNIYLYGDITKLNSNTYRIGKSNEPISLNSQTTRITYTGNILDTSDCNYVIVSCSIYKTGTTFDDIKNSFMIVEGSSEPSVFEPYGYKVPVVVSGKNLLDEANAVVTDYYLTNDGQEAVGASGDRFLKSYINVNPSTEYTFKWSQTIMGYSNNTPYIRITEYTSNKTFIKRVLCQCSAQSQNNYTFTTSNNTVYIDIRIDSETSTRGQHITEVMLVKGATAPDTYEPYHDPTTTNIYLDEPIEENESISLSDTNVNIPTIRGTNILSIDTTVQPSNVYVKARKESSYEAAMRERYEQELSDIKSALEEV